MKSDARDTLTAYNENARTIDIHKSEYANSCGCSSGTLHAHQNSYLTQTSQRQMAGTNLPHLSIIGP